MASRLLLVLLTFVVGALMNTGCSRCSREEPVAKLESMQGDVRRSVAAHVGSWNPTAIGAVFLLGDGLRTAHAAEAVLGLDDGSKLRVRQDTTIRFSNRRPEGKKQAFDVEAGQVLVEAGPSELSLVTRLGIARVQANGKLLIHRSAEGLQYDVTVGLALFESSDGQQRVDAGQSYFVSVGAAIVELAHGDAGRPLASNPPMLDAAVAPTGVPEDGLPAHGSTRLEGRGLDYSDISAEAGESFVVHDPRPPTAIRLQFAGRCRAGGVIRVSSGSGAQFASGESSAALAFGAGRHNYTLHCLGDSGPTEATTAKGNITVLKDAGTRPVPTTPPATSISIDGREYTVMYQNQLPRIAIAWPHAPSAPNYTLHVESRSGTKTYTTAAPAYSFTSGALPEGHHTIYFEGGGRISRRTGVEIAFDNAAPMASLVTPVDPDVSQGGEITVAGVAQPGWSVEIEGVKVEQDSKQRFNQGVQMPSAQRALAVKLTHPSRGTHVYLRRATKAL